MPAFAFARDKTVETDIYGPVTVDIGYGGAFYAVVPANQFGLDVKTSRTRDLVDAASIVTAAVKVQVPLAHPDNDDPLDLFGGFRGFSEVFGDSLRFSEVRCFKCKMEVLLCRPCQRLKPALPKAGLVCPLCKSNK